MTNDPVIRLKLYRNVFTDKSTIGDLFVDEKWECHTLEDTCRLKKIPQETAIPSGIYDITMHQSPRFNRELPMLVGVPHFMFILIHNGNDAKDTAGCILVGRRRGDNTVSESLSALDALVPKIKKMLSEGPVKMAIYGGYHDVRPS